MSPPRFLAPVEQLVDAFDRAATMNFTVVARLSGKFTQAELEHALRRLEQRHPLLRARIDRTGKRLRFVPGEAAPIPLQVLQGTQEAVTHFAQASLADRLWDDAGPRAQLTWLRHSAQSSTLLLCLHHVVSDGSSGVFAMRDLLTLLADPSLTLAPLPAPPQSALYPRGHGNLFWIVRALFSALRGAFGSKPKRLHASTQGPRETRLKRLWLSEHDTRELVTRAKRDGATVHGVLCAALARALAHELGISPVKQRIMHPVDLRRYLPAYYRDTIPGIPGEGSGYYVSSIDTVHRVDLTRPLSALAQAITEAVRTRKQRGEPLLSAPLAGPWLTARVAPTGKLNAFGERAERLLICSSFGITNLGPLEALGVAASAAPLELEDLHFVAAMSVVAAVGAAVSTYRGRLTLSFAWRVPTVSEEAGLRVFEHLEAELRAYLGVAAQPVIPEAGHAGQA